MNDLKTAAQQVLEALRFYAEESHHLTLTGFKNGKRIDWDQERDRLEKAGYRFAHENHNSTEAYVEDGRRARDALNNLEEALSQQTEPVQEPVAAERERCAEYLMQQAAECRENSPTRVTLESCAAVLRLGLVEWVAWEGWWLHHGQHNYRAKPLTSERVKELMKLAFEVGREAAPPQQAEPVEPVAWAFRHSDGTYHDPSVTEHSAGMVPLYPPHRSASRPPSTINTASMYRDTD